MNTLSLLHRELLIAARNPGEWLTPLIFFLLVVTIFPLAVGPDATTLAHIAPGVIWAIALLSSLLAQEKLFRSDAADGTLEQLLLAPQPLVLSMLAKSTAHWLTYGAPLVVLSPFLGIWLRMQPDSEALWIMPLTLALGTAIFSLLAVFTAALAVGAPRNSFLGPLLALPLCLPAVIFAAAAIVGQATLASLLLLAAFFTLALTVLPLATAGALRCNAEANGS